MIEEKNKDKFSKLLPLAILVLFISTFVRNCYIIFSVDINETILEGLTKLSREILLALYIFTTRVLIPGLVYLFVAWITYRMLEKRGFKRIMDGNKFLSILLFFISVALAMYSSKFFGIMIVLRNGSIKAIGMEKNMGNNKRLKKKVPNMATKE